MLGPVVISQSDWQTTTLHTLTLNYTAMIHCEGNSDLDKQKSRGILPPRCYLGDHSECLTDMKTQAHTRTKTYEFEKVVTPLQPIPYCKCMQQFVAGGAGQLSGLGAVLRQDQETRGKVQVWEGVGDQGGCGSMGRSRRPGKMWKYGKE